MTRLSKNGKPVGYSKWSLVTDWRKVTYDDVDTTRLDTHTSVHAANMAREFSERLGMTRSQFVEIAIMSACPGSVAWQKSVSRYQRAVAERKYLGILRRRLIKQKNQPHEVLPSDIRRVFDEIAESNLCGAELEAFVKQHGLAFSIEDNDVGSE
ncbi:MAG: hypothetical protein ACXWT0_01740 [Methylobacter sp.]